MVIVTHMMKVRLVSAYIIYSTPCYAWLFFLPLILTCYSLYTLYNSRQNHFLISIYFSRRLRSFPPEIIFQLTLFVIIISYCDSYLINHLSFCLANHFLISYYFLLYDFAPEITFLFLSWFIASYLFFTLVPISYYSN